jgi:hypothetical protein
MVGREGKKPMSDYLAWSDEEWEQKRAEEDARIEALSKTLKPCTTHGNPCSIEEDFDCMIILAPECGCWANMEGYDSIEEMVEHWNNQPQIDRLQTELEYLRRRIAYYEEPIPSEAGRCAHRFTGEGICIRCGEDAEEWDAGCVEEIVAEALEWRSELDQLQAQPRWEPVENKFSYPDDWGELMSYTRRTSEGDLITLHINNVTVGDQHTEAFIDLPDDLRLCRLVYPQQPQEDNDA